MTPITTAYRSRLAEENPVRAEAELFGRIAAQLEFAATLGALSPRRVRALADARRLWLHTATLCSDPENRLPRELRAQIISVAMAVLREIDSEAPDVTMLAETTRAIADGLADAARRAAPPAPEPAEMAAGV